MKAENQALHLERLMQKHQVHPEYELCLPPVAVRKNLLKKLSRGDVILLGMEEMEIVLVSEGSICANAILISYGESMTVQIAEPVQEAVNSLDSKKYKKLFVSLGSVRSRMVEAGHKIETASMDPDDISLIVGQKKIATARLVIVDDEIAVEIKEVKRR